MAKKRTKKIGVKERYQLTRKAIELWFLSTKRKLKRLKKKWLSKIKYWRYVLSLKTFLRIKKLRYVVNTFIFRYWFYILSIFYLVASVVLAFKLNVPQTRDEAANLLVNSAVMVGGSLAIVVTFAQFTIQNAAENLPKNFYRIATNLGKYLAVFLLNTGICIALLSGATLYGKLGLGLSRLSINIAFLLIAMSFYFLLLLLYWVREDVNADNILRKVVSELVNTLRRVQHNTEQYAKKLVANPKNQNKPSLEIMLAQLYQSPAFNQQLEYIKRRIAYLFDYHDSLVQKQEKSSALEVLTDIRNIVLQYLQVRKDSSLSFPEPLALLAVTSDSKYVMQPILERIISLGENYMQVEDTSGIIKVVDVFSDWASFSANIKYVNWRRNDNPIFEQITGYFDQLMDRAIKRGSLEGLFQGLRFYKITIGVCIEKLNLHEFSSAIGRVEELGYQGILRNQGPVISEAFGVYSLAIEKLVETGSGFIDHFLSLLMKHIQSLTEYGYVYTSKGGLRDNLTAQQDVALPYKTLSAQVFKSANKAVKARSIAEKRKWRNITLKLVEELGQSLRLLADKFENPNHFIILTFGNLIEEVGTLLVQLSSDQRWSSEQRQLLGEVQRYVNLPSFFMPRDNRSVKQDQSFEALFEAVASIGIEAITKGLDETAEAAINILSRTALKMLDRQKTDGGLYVEPWLMELACYIGIIAKKQNKNALVNLLKNKVSEFDEKYRTNYFTNMPEGVDPYRVSPPVDKLKRDIIRLTDERGNWEYNRFPGMEGSREKLFSQCIVQDIGAFVNVVWEQQRS